MYKEEKPRYPYLDALRGIAILLVIMYHTTLFMVHGAGNFLFRISGEGTRGVQLFYIVSALTLFLSLNSSFFSGKTAEKIKFFSRRFFRIAPLFYFVIGAFFVLVIVLFPAWQESIRLDFNWVSVISSMTFTNNFIPEYMNVIVPGQWSIAIEMFFYLMVPSFFLRIKNLSTAKKYFLWTLAIASIIELLLPLFFTSVGENVKIILFYSIPIQLPSFMLGFVAFFLLFKKNEDGSSPSLLKEFSFLFISTSVCEILFLIIRFLLGNPLDISLITPRVYMESVLLLGLVLLLSKGYLFFLQNKVLQYIGKVSYSVYLIHFISFAIITKNSFYPKIAGYFTNGYEEYIFLFIITSTLSVGIASLTFWLIESPGQKFGSYFSKKVVSWYNNRSLENKC